MEFLSGITSFSYLFDIIIIFVIVCVQKRNPLTSIAWIFALLLFPTIGGIMFLIFGVGLRSYNKRKYLEKYLMKEKSILDTQKKLIKEQYENDLPDSATINYFLDKNCVFCSRNDVKIFTDARDKYKNLFEDIKNARKNINIEYFIVRNDVVGNELIDLLLKKVREGVHVRLMYDGWGSFFTPKRFFNRLRTEKNCEVWEFFPVRIFSMSKINHRNHRKIVVIDDEIAYIGGMNIGDEYMSKNKKRNLPWRDTHIRVVGDAVQRINECFAFDWEFSTGKQVDMAEYAGDKEPGADSVAMQIVTSGPDSENEEIKCGMIRMLYSAKKYAYIQTPYFVPDQAFMTAVKTAIQSGVDVRFMIPGMPDKKYVYHTTMSYIGELLAVGARVFLYPGFIHSKTIAVDDRMSTIGTTNIDIRSFRLLFEINAFMYSENVAEECREIFEKDQEVCHELFEDEYKKRGVIRMIKEGFFRLFSPIF